MPSPTPSPGHPRKRGRPRGLNPSPRAIRADRLAVAVEILAALAALPPTPSVDELSQAIGRAPGELAPALAAMERGGLIERWTDGGRLGTMRLMLSQTALARLGLRLAARGDRWEPVSPGPSNRGGCATGLRDSRRF